MLTLTVRIEKTDWQVGLQLDPPGEGPTSLNWDPPLGDI